MICLCIGDVEKKPLIGGHENNVVRMSKILNERGYEIGIITTPGIHSKEISSKEFELDWGKIYSLHMRSSYGSAFYALEFWIRAFFLLKNLKEAGEIDLIHGHSGHPIIGFIVGVSGKLLRIPAIHTLYCPISDNYIRKLFDRACLIAIENIISLSNNSYRSLIKLGIPDKKIRIIPPIIDHHMKERFNKNFDNKYLKGSSEPMLLYLGDLTKGRGLHILIDSLSIVVNKIPNIKLILAINLPKEKYDKAGNNINNKIKKYKIEKNIYFLGIAKDMPKTMYECTAFIAPYLDIDTIADYPISIIESMTVGTPVIATKVGGIPEIITNGVNGIVIKPGDLYELQDRIVYLIEHPEFARDIGLAAREYIINHFNADNTINELEKVYHEVYLNYYSN